MGIRAFLFLIFISLFIFSPIYAQADLQIIAPDNVEQLQEIARYGDGVLNDAVSWSPDGTTLAIGGTLGVWLYDTQDWSAAPTLLSMSTVSDLAFSPDGTRLAVITEARMSILDSATYTELYQLEARSPVEWSPDSTLIATENGTAFGGEIILWDAESGEQAAWGTLINGPDVIDIKFSMDNSQITALGKSDRADEVRYAVWEVARGIETGNLEDGLLESYGLVESRFGCCADVFVSPTVSQFWHDISTRAIRYILSADRQTIAYSNGGHIEVQRQAGPVTVLPTSSYGVIPLIFSPDGEQLVISEADRITILNWAAGTEITSFLRGTPNIYATPSYGVITIDNTQRLIDLRTGDELLNLAVRRLQVSTNGATAVTLDYDYTLRVWDIAAQNVLMTLPDDFGYRLLTLSPDGTRLILQSSVASDGSLELELWDTLSGEIIQTFQIDGSYRIITSEQYMSMYIAFNLDNDFTLINVADGDSLPNSPSTLRGSISVGSTHLAFTTYSTSGQAETHLWEIGSPDEPVTYEGWQSQFSLDGQMLYIHRSDGGLDVVDIGHNLVITEIEMEEEDHQVGYVVEGDGRIAYVDYYNGIGSYPTAVYLHEFGGESQQIHLPQSDINLMSFSPDNNLLLVLDGDTLYFFDGHNGALLWEMQQVIDASFSSDGTQLYIVSDNRTVQVYGVVTQ
jgi:WD40 repeat protein